MRMVTFDFCDRDSDNRELLYECEGPGAYICGLSVAGRDGRAWSRNENIKLIQHLDSYSLAIDACEKRDKDDAYGNSQFTAEELAALGVATAIDLQYGKDKELDNTQTYQMPRFASISQAGNSRHVRELTSTLKRRNVSDECPDEPSLQSMYMVGASDDVDRSKQSHRLITSLGGTTHLWGLLASCLKYMDLNPEETIIPVCKAWKVEHINFSEILVTVLAGSLVSVGGLNVAQPGGKSEKNPPSERILERCRTHVWGVKPWLEENLQHTYNAHPDVQRLAAAQKELDSIDLDELRKKAEEEEESRNELISLNLRLEKLVEERRKNNDKIEAWLEKYKEEEKISDQIFEILMRISGGSDDGQAKPA
ncbi:hypothetical protein F4779DRAFT_579106 [Xylariaceae sp. FL0662B]|nr:hypothetical protein F4779DRAFT_579106 [Xylariaceae sp. FL0662B]